MTELSFCQGPYEVVCDLLRSPKKRSKVQLIRWKDGRLVVMKQFLPKFHDSFRREVNVLAHLGTIEPELMPPILEVGPDYFISPYYKNTYNLQTWRYKLGLQLMPLNVVLKVFRGARHFYEHGYIMLDFAPENVLVLENDGIRFIDYEHWYRKNGSYTCGPFEKSYTITGAMPDWDEQHPGAPMTGQFYNDKWIRATGLSIESVLYDHRFIQHIKRWFFMLRAPFIYLIKSIIRKNKHVRFPSK